MMANRWKLFHAVSISPSGSEYSTGRGGCQNAELAIEIPQGCCAVLRCDLGRPTDLPDVLQVVTDERRDDCRGLVIQMNMIRQQFQVVFSRNRVPAFALHEVLDPNPNHWSLLAFIGWRRMILRQQGS